MSRIAMVRMISTCAIAALLPFLLSCAWRQHAELAVGDEMTLDLGSGHRMEFVWIPAGEFVMGTKSGRSDEKPAHRARITKGFWMGKYEVTQDQWKAVMGSNPSAFQDAGGNAPVEQVSWDDCREFLGRLNARFEWGASTIGSGGGTGPADLPTEAEWEYACRAGTTTEYYTGDTGSDLSRATTWYYPDDYEGLRTTHPVGKKEPNVFGLYDMHGNVCEWCADWYGGDYYAKSCSRDPQGPPDGFFRVFRGGGVGRPQFVPLRRPKQLFSVSWP